MITGMMVGSCGRLCAALRGVVDIRGRPQRGAPEAMRIIAASK